MSPAVEDNLRRIRESSLVVASHSAHVWKDLPPWYAHMQDVANKRNDWLIRGFAGYVARSGDARAVLAVWTYGGDVENSKNLIRELGIEAQVIWFPLMPRKEILEVLRLVDVGGTEFSGHMWGGGGREFLAVGVPFLHYLPEVGAYAERDIDLPPFFNVSSPEAITEVLLSQTRESFREMGAKAKDFFDRHNGIHLAEKYRDLLEEAVASK